MKRVDEETTAAFAQFRHERLKEMAGENGLAWWYRKYAPRDRQLATLEAEAWKAKRGLWADREPVPPWEWRSRPRDSGHTEKPSGDSQSRYWLNQSSGVRHNSSCPWFGRTKRGRYCGPEEGKACGECGG
jgi:hypothetical protein